MPPESPRLAPPLQNSFRGRCYSNVCKKLSQISTASNRQKHLGARRPTYPRADPGSRRPCLDVLSTCRNNTHFCPRSDRSDYMDTRLYNVHIIATITIAQN